MVGPAMRNVSLHQTLISGWLTLVLLACGDTTSGVMADLSDSAAEVDLGGDTSPQEVAEVGDWDAASEVGDEGDAGVGDGGLDEVIDVVDGEGGEVVDAVTDPVDGETGEVMDVVLDVATDTAEVEVSPAVLTCPVGSMEALYAGVLPPNPYGAWPAATDCVKQYHDVIIVLGCPSEGNGSPANCQTSRVDIALRLKSAGYGDRFIVSGGAVHNQWVEAEGLRALLLSRGVANERIWLEPQAEHTDENLYYSTQIMVAQGWRSALVVSNDPGHLMMTALCDSNCCVELGRLTLFAMPVTGGLFPNDNVGHYVLIPPAQASTVAECTTIQGPIKFMCTNLGSRKACKANFQL